MRLQTLLPPDEEKYVVANPLTRDEQMRVELLLDCDLSTIETVRCGCIYRIYACFADHRAGSRDRSLGAPSRLRRSSDTPYAYGPRD